MRSTLLPSFLAMSAAAASAAPPGAPATDLPVREVALFSSGVGYFQHAGPVRDNATTELRFKASQINDILKSMVLADLSGGTVGVVTYPSQDPVEKALRSFQVDITGNPNLADLLNQLRGAKVTVNAGPEKLSGTVLGVETRETPTGGADAKSPAGGSTYKAAFLNLITPTGIRSLAVADLRGLAFDDPALNAELEKALTTLSAARDKDKKTVALAFNGKGERQVRVGYVVETPVWKTTYRLVFAPDNKPRLQGWALVENQTEADWNDVKLSLVSGRPISFVQDLYQPLYVTRPVVQNEVRAGVAPPRYEAGRAMPGAMPPPAPAPASVGSAAMRPMAKQRAARGGGPMAESYDSPRLDDSAPSDSDGSSSIIVDAAAGEVGELFKYTVPGVTLPRQRSAMIPIVNDNIEAEKLSIFNAVTHPKFPLNGARLKNSAGLHLLAGPITVFDENVYAGDARIGDVPPGQTRLLSYGMDLQLPVSIENIQSSRRLVSGKIVGGVLELSRKVVSSRTYLAENKSSRPKKLVIEHPRPGSDWKLADTAAPAETTTTLWRFDVNVAAGKTEKLDVKEERTEGERIELVSADSANLLAYLKEGEFPAPVRDALRKAAQLRQAVAETEARAERVDEEVNRITTEQQRLRENLKSAGEKSEYGARLLRKLNEQESQIEKLQADAAALRRKAEAQEKELSDYLKGLTLG